MEAKEDFTSEINRLLAGGFTGCVVRAIVQPLDVLKIRFQLQIEPIKMSSHVSKYKSLPQSVINIVKEEGITSLWKGHVPAQLLSVSFTSVQFSSFHFVQRSLEPLFTDRNHVQNDGQHPAKELKNGIGDKQTINYLVSGSLSGIVAATVTHPFDTIRTRLVSQGEPKLYKNMSSAFMSMIRNENGFRSLFKGLKANLILVAPQTGLTFGSYKLFKDIWSSLFDVQNGASQGPGDRNNGSAVFKNLFCGASSGIVSKTIVYPFDSVKKRLQVQGFEDARLKFGSVQRYNSSIDCLIRIIREESFFGLFKGYQPTLIKSGLSTAINFALFEYLIGL